MPAPNTVPPPTIDTVFTLRLLAVGAGFVSCSAGLAEDAAGTVSPCVCTCVGVVAVGAVAELELGIALLLLVVAVLVVLEVLVFVELELEVDGVLGVAAGVTGGVWTGALTVMVPEPFIQPVLGQVP